MATKKRPKNNRRTHHRFQKRHQEYKPVTLQQVCILIAKRFQKTVSNFHKRLSNFYIQVTTFRQSGLKHLTATTIDSRKFYLLLLVMGIVLTFISIFNFTYAQTVLSFRGSPVLTIPQELRKTLPTSISIPSINIQHSLTESEIIDGIWQVSDTQPTHLQQSANPGERGNIVIYGHNRQHIFGKLSKIKVDDVITLQNEAGSEFEYKVREIKVVDPGAVGEIAPTDYEVLTVFTCTGFLDSKRLVIKAYPYRVSS